MYRRLSVVLAALVSPFLAMVPAEAAAASCDGRRATIVGTPADDTLHGTNGDDVIAGLTGGDTILGHGGNDRICGGYGADRLYGGAGRDRVFGGMDRLFVNDEGSDERIGDQVRGGTGRDLLVPGRDTRPADEVTHDAIIWDTSAQGVRVYVASGTAYGQGPDTFDSRDAWLVGSEHDDLISGGAGRDLIQGGRGNDTLRGNGGADVVFADDGSGPQRGDDVVEGGSGDDELSSTAGQDLVHGGRGNDTVADDGNTADLLYGDSGRDLLIGQLSFADRPQGYFGGTGIDRLALLTSYVNPTAAASHGTWDMGTGAMGFSLTGGGSLDLTARGIEDADFTTFGTGWDVKGTDAANDLSAVSTAGTDFDALAGNDTFFGSSLDDVFAGGPGADHSRGMGAGSDTCVSVEVLDQMDCETVLP